jgi:hypothetical protein
MIGTKPDLILRSLTQPELNRLDRFLPGAAGSEAIMEVWAYIKPFYKERIPEALHKDKIWAAAYGKKKSIPLRYARLLSDLTRVIERFLLLEHISAQDTDRAITLLQIYNKRGLSSCIAPIISTADQCLDRQDHRDGDYYLSRYKVDEQKNSYIENQDRRDSESHLSQTIRSLDIYYVIQKLRYYATMLH